MEQHLRILGLALNNWTDQWTNRQHLLSRLGRRHVVLYSNQGWFNWDVHFEDWWQARFAGEITASDNVWVDSPPRYLLRIPRIPLLEKLALRLLARRWNDWLSEHGRGPRILQVFHPALFPYARFVQKDILAYHAYDLFDHTPGWNEQMEHHEIALLNAADLVTTSSDAIAQALQKKVQRNILVLPNGVDIDAFDRARSSATRVPADLDAIPRPRLGYVGSLAPTVDYGLLAELARRRPDWNFVLIGGKIGKFDAIFEAAYLACQALPNVHFLGPKHVREVAAYIVNMDVNLMLYRISDETWIKAIYPLKLHEYLAAGRPVVSADIASVRPFSAVVRITSGVEDWHQAICEALEGGMGDPEQRRRVASQNSWEVRVQVLENWLLEFIGARESSNTTLTPIARE